jgi:hypothetical protein
VEGRQRAGYDAFAWPTTSDRYLRTGVVHCVVPEEFGCRIFSPPLHHAKCHRRSRLTSPCRGVLASARRGSLRASVRRPPGCLIGVGQAVSSTCDGTQRRLRPLMKLPLGGIKCPEMIRVALTDAPYDAIASTLPKGAARWPMQRDRGQCFIQVEAAVVDRMRAMRRPGESYSQVILRLVELETGDLK